MAENGIEILVDVLTSEGVTSLDELTNVLTSTIGKADVLAGSIDDLDGALTGLAKSGMSAESMAAGIATAMEDAGVQFKDVDGFVTILSKSLEGLGAAGEKAAGGIDLTVKANEELAGSADTATSAVERQSGAVKVLGTETDITAGVMKSFAASSVASSIAAGAAVEDLGSGFTKMTTLSEMATPALMKAATWAGVGLAGLAYEGIKQYTAFNKLITQTITQAGEAPSKMGFLTNLAESVAKSTGQNLDDVANTIYRAASGTASWNNGLGATKKQLGDIVTQVSKLNVVGGIATGAESEQASRVVTALINSNIRGVGKNPTQAAALVNAVVGSGDMRLADLVPGIGRGLLSSAVANNVSAKDVMAWVATLTSQGTTASVAGNYVKTGINLLAHPSAQGVEALAMLGIKPGEMENELSSPGGLVSALSTLKTGMKQLNPSSMSKYFFHEAGAVYPGGSGLQGAVAKLQTWSAGELSPQFIKDWEANKLTSKEQTQATDLILTKAFGGSKQFATIAAVINNLGLVKGIESHISAEDTPGYFNAQYRRTEATPSQQFKKMGQNLLVDLVNIGHTLTPLALTFGHIMTGVIDGLSKFKGAIMGFAGLALGLLGFAGVSKLATLATHLSPFIGGAYNRLGSIAGEDSAFTKGMTANANGGAFKFLNIYKTKRHGLLSKMGGESIMANGVPASDEAALSPDGTALNTNISKSNVLLEQIATNTRVTAGAAEEGDVTGAGGLGGKMRAAESSTAAYAPQFRDPVTGRFLSAAESAPIAARLSEEESAAQTAAMYYGATGRGRSIRSFKTGMSGGADTAAANIESTAAARESSSLLGGVDQGVGQYGPALEGGLANAAAPELLSAGGDGMLAGLGEMAGGIMGGPVGMIGMMAAPMLIGALTPALGKLGSLLGDLFGGSSAPVYHPHNKNPLDVTSASAKLATATKALRAYQREVKNKAGKEVWVNNEDAVRANGAGYLAARKAYDKAAGVSTQATKNANVVDLAALDYTYGSKHGTLKALQDAALKRAKEISSGAGLLGSPQMGIGHPGEQRNTLKAQKDDLDKYVAGVLAALPASDHERALRQTQIWKRVNKNGAGNYAEDYKDIAKILGAQQKYYKKVTLDAATESAQQLTKNSPAFAQLETGGFFSNSTALKLNRSQMSSFLSSKSVGPRAAAELLPQYANKYHQIFMADQKALAATGANKLTGTARAYAKDQETQANDQLKKTDELIQAMRKAQADTKLDDGSVTKLAKENASQLVASGLPQDIANALAGVLSKYIKTPKSGGTSTTVTTANSSPGNLSGVVAAGSAG